MNRFLVAGALLNLIFNTSAVHAADDGLQVRTLSSAAAGREQYDREVDQAALSAQDSSINRLITLLKKYTGNQRQEPILLSKLGELQQQKSAILFRIVHGAASKKGGKLELGTYKKSLQQTVSTFSSLIDRYPNYPDIASAYFMRGKSYEEMENKTAAAKDYLFLVKNFPEAEQTTAAYMSLAEFAIDANNHPLAITYLKEVEKRPEDAHYPFALYKLAWSYYNLKNVPQALAYAEKQIAYYNEKFPDQAKEKQTDVFANSDSALKENTLLDVPLFYFQGTEDHDDRFKALGALDYFRKLEKGPLLGKMSYRFAKLIRSRNMEKDLIAWKNQFLDTEATRPEALDIIIITYEYLQNQRNFTALVDTAKDVLKLYAKVGRAALLKHENLAKAQKMILDTAENLQGVIVKNKQTQQAKDLSVTLAALYETFTQVVVETDPRIPQVHYNLAETLFTIENFEGATTHYRWIVDHWTSIPKTVFKSVADSPLKAIAARYEVLRGKGLIPKDVKAIALSRDEKKSTLDPLLESWIGWIDTLGEELASSSRHLKKGEAEPEPFKTWDNFNFEANRAIYVSSSPRLAVERLTQFAKKRPKSAYGIPSASLVLDTYVTGQDWDATIETAMAFHKLDPWKSKKDDEFGHKLYELASDALYKKIEQKYQAKLYKDALEQADDFVSEYKDSIRVPDALSLAGAAALANGEKERAMGYFTQLIKTDKDPGRVSDALIARASLQEEKYLFAASVADYQGYITLVQTDTFKDTKRKPSSDKILDLKRKVLALAWLSADGALMKSLVDNKSVCVEKLESECDKYRAVSALQQSAQSAPDEERTIAVFNRVHKMDSSEAKTLWAIYALQGSQHLAFRDRNHILRAVGSGWKDLDPMSKLFALPYLNQAVVKAFDQNRVAMKDVAPLKANEKFITHRVDSIRELENAVAKIMDLPWARVRAETINELASVYLDLSKGLADLPAPKGLTDAEAASYQDTIRKLTLPFEDKANEIRSKAFEMASRFAIENDSFEKIATPFFAENPSQAKKLKSLTEESHTGVAPGKNKIVALGMDYLPIIRKAHELASQKSEGSQATALLDAWVTSVKNHNWVQVAFFLQEAKDKKYLSEPELGLVRAVSLAEAGARGEGILELEDARKTLDPQLAAVVSLTLAKAYESSYAASRAKELYAQFVPPAPVVAKDKADATPERKPASR